MENRKALSVLSYASVFFAPLLLPIIIYFVAKEHEVKHHAKAALISHILPFASVIIFFIVVIGGMMATMGANGEPSLGMGIGTIVGFGFIAILNFGVVVWNVIRMIKVLQQ